MFTRSLCGRVQIQELNSFRVKPREEGKERVVKRGEEKGRLGICNRVSERRDNIGLTIE